MDFVDTDIDPYASYDPDAEEPFEFYDEGVDPYGDDELYFADGVPPPGYDEYEEIYDDAIYDEEPIYTEDWLPVPPDAIPLETIPIEERPPEYGTELYIGGLQHPDPAIMRDAYCQIYPEACGEGQQGLSGREPYNRTEAAEEMSRTLKDVDITGVAIAALLLLVLLFGLHYGGDSAGDAAQPPETRRTREDTPADPAAERKKYSDALKAAGHTDDKARDKLLDKVMAEPDPRKRKEKVDKELEKYYDKELKDAGYDDDKERAETVKKLLQQPVEKRADKLKEYKDRKKRGQAQQPPTEDTPDAGNGRPRRSGDGQPRTNGDTPAPGAKGPTEEEIEKVAEALEKNKIADKDNKEAKRIAALPKDQQSQAIKDLKTNQTKDGLDADLKKAGYTDDAERKKLVDQLAAMPSKDRAAKLKELEKAKKNATQPPSQPGNGKGKNGDTPGGEAPTGDDQAMSDEEIKKKLANKRLTEPELQKDLLKQIRAAGGPPEQRKELDKILGKPTEERQKMNEEARTKRKAAEALAQPAGQDPPSNNPTGEPGAPTGNGNGKRKKGDKGTEDTPGGNQPGAPTEPAKSGPPSKEDVEKELKRHYPDEVVQKMLADYDKETDPKKKAAMFNSFIKPENKDRYMKKYGGKAPSGPSTEPAESGPPSKEDVEKELKKHYPDEVVRNMLADYEKETDPRKKAAMYNSFIKPENKDRYMKKYRAKAPSGPPSSEDLRKELKDRGFPDDTIDKMVAEYDGTEPKKKQALYNDMTNPERKDRMLQKYPAGDGDGKGPGKKDDKGKDDANGNDNANAEQPSQPPTKGGKATSGPPSEADLRKSLEARKYPSKAIEPMLKKYREAPNDDERKKLADKWKTTDKDKIKEIAKEFVPPKTSDNPSDPNDTAANEPASDTGGKKKSKFDSRDKLLDKLKRRYPKDVSEKMADEWDKADDAGKVALENEFLDPDKDKRAETAKRYASTSPPGSENGEEKVAGYKLGDLHEELKKRGYTDKDARDEIIDELRKKAPDDEAKQKARLKQKFLQPNANVEDLNKQYGDARRARKAGAPETDAGKSDSKSGLPSDEEMHKLLKDKGWDDEDARNQIIDMAKKRSSPSKQRDTLDHYLKDGAVTDDEKKRLARAWKKNHPPTQMTPEERAKYDKELADKGYSDKARKNMLDELDDPARTKKDDIQKKLNGWKNLPDDKRTELNEQREKAQDAADAKGRRRRQPGGDADNPDEPPKDPKGRARRPGGEGGTPDSSSAGFPWWLLLLLAIPLIFALARDVQFPTGRLPVSVPSFPSIRAPWIAREVPAIPVVGGPKINRGLPEFPMRKTTSRSKSSPRLGVRSSKDAGAPAININNVNAQGENIPIDINSGAVGGGGDVLVADEVVVEETVVEEVVMGAAGEPVVVAETVEETVVVTDGEPAAVVVEEEVVTVIEEEPIIELQGPADPNRLFWMIISALVISLPLILDTMAGWPERTSGDCDYLSIPVHWAVLITAFVLLYLKVERTFRQTTLYVQPAMRSVRPVVAGAVHGADRLFWGMDEAMFGESEYMLGLLAIGAAALLVMFIGAGFSSDLVSIGKGISAAQFGGLVGLGLISLFLIYA